MTETDPSLTARPCSGRTGARPPERKSRSFTAWCGEARRARRLIFGTIVVWCLWTAMTVALVAVAFFTAVKAPELPAGAVPPPVPTVAGPQMLVSGIGAFLLDAPGVPVSPRGGDVTLVADLPGPVLGQHGTGPRSSLRSSRS